MKFATTRLFAVLLSLAIAGAAQAGDDDDHEQALRAVREGKARPLGEVLERVRAQFGGEVVGVEFDRQDGRYIYELRVILPGGQLREVSVDALTATIVAHGDD